MSQEEITTNNKSIPLIYILIDSIKLIFIQNPKLFFIIYITGALPVSVFLTYISVSDIPRKLKSHIDRLDGLYWIVDNWIEAGNIKETSHRDLKLLYRFKVVHFLPVLIFSLFTVIAVVTTVTLTYKKKSRPTLRTIVTALKVGWNRPVITCVITGLFQVVWGQLVPILTTAVGYPKAVVVSMVAVVVEVYAMMVISLAVVVSVAEQRSGVEAVRVGSGLMKGRRVSGWVLSGLILLSTNLIGRKLVGVMDGRDWIGINDGYKWTVEIGLIILLGWVILWSYVVVTVFYCDCRKRNAVIRQNDVELLDCDIEN